MSKQFLKRVILAHFLVSITCGSFPPTRRPINNFCFHRNPLELRTRSELISEIKLLSLPIFLLRIAKFIMQRCLELRFYFLCVKVDRPISTAVYFFLPTGNVSNLHRIPSAETWHFYLGEPITIMEIDDKNRSVAFLIMNVVIKDHGNY
ncbi:rmlC-like jelly roll fold protein [Artemisia annua]|uniref:RmlC-like jelly roll fold protein n=1 Tax=Artemisia annua TaxID=35608 RepID=A0A2U1PPF1_ARTAN|nr:rmlC-like jelly roll fold protein [Artemisia annua]